MMVQQVLCWQAWMVAKVAGGVDAMARRVGRIRGEDAERGNISTQQVIWIAVGAALAIAAAGVITVLVMNKVNGIDLDTPNP